jgi:hypothetical protein
MEINGPPSSFFRAKIAKLEAAMKEKLAEIETWRDKHEAATKRGRKGGKKRQETQQEDDEPEWVTRAVDIAEKARDANPTINSTDIINEQIIPRCNGMVGFVGFDMLMKYMARWEAAGRVQRKVKVSLTAPRNKRRASAQRSKRK